MKRITIKMLRTSFSTTMPQRQMARRPQTFYPNTMMLMKLWKDARDRLYLEEARNLSISINQTIFSTKTTIPLFLSTSKTMQVEDLKKELSWIAEKLITLTIKNQKGRLTLVSPSMISSIQEFKKITKKIRKIREIKIKGVDLDRSYLENVRINKEMKMMMMLLVVR